MRCEAMPGVLRASVDDVYLGQPFRETNERFVDVHFPLRAGRVMLRNENVEAQTEIALTL